MTRRKPYMVTGFGVSKKTGEPYSQANAIRLAKDTTWGFLDSKDSYFLDEIRPLGYVFEIEQTVCEEGKAADYEIGGDDKAV